jgi:D-3-phosphoglycerate dehydrogenase / 2-oxoglutarate reductase
MKVLVADRFEQSGIAGLEAAGCEVVYAPELEDEALARALAETHAGVLVVRSTRVTEAMLDAGRLSLVVRAGAGYNTIDVAAAARRGIYVSNCPGKNAVAVAELTMALALALDRRLPDNVADLRAGRWNKKEYSKARGLHGRTLGLLGTGSIAREVIRRAAAFGLNAVVWSRRFAGEDRPLGKDDALRLGLDPGLPVALAPTPAAVAERCDILSVHLAATPETRGMVDAALLAKLKPGAMLINTSRGELVDYPALTAAVETRGLRVGLDVYRAEPPAATGEIDDPLVRLPGVYGTHHIGASTEQAQEAIAAETVRIVRTYLETGEVPNVVNLCRKTPATHTLVVRHRDRPGVLAHVFEHLRGENLNVQETDNVVFEGAAAAVARIDLDVAPSPALLARIRDGNPDIIDLQLIAL